MRHDFAAQRKDTFDTFRQSKGVKLPQTAVVEFAFFVEENDANWAGFERALRHKGFRIRKLGDNETVIAAVGPIPVTAEDVWHWEELSTIIALDFDFYPDGWELAD